jgi:23S rRNA (cytidine1920-2'-O)/16S rRNA (cytidine1409-2'-O)-methyltransferase
VTIDGAPAAKPATQVLASQALVLLAPPRQYVSRGGHKLAQALDRFGLDPQGRRCLDAGISTGGFTDCLLQRGATDVFGVDVGYGQVHERLRTDDRVTIRERTNIRDVSASDVPQPLPDLLVADLSFIALRLVLPVLVSLIDPSGDVVALVKPQFEAQRGDVGKGGVVRDVEVWRRVLTDVATSGAALGWPVVGLTASPITGPAGNVEFLAHLRAPDSPAPATSNKVASSMQDVVDAAVSEGIAVRSGSSATSSKD